MHVFTTVLNFFKMQIANFQEEGVGQGTKVGKRGLGTYWKL